MGAFVAFVLANTRHGAMIVNRFDRIEPAPGEAVGVGAEIMEIGEYQGTEGAAIANIMLMRRDAHGPGVVALDVGANIGAHTCRWARACEGWGEVQAFEAQERVFYALAGNLAIGNHFNAHAYHVAIGAQKGRLTVPSMDHRAHGNFGGLSLRPTDGREPGQTISYDSELEEMAITTIDSMDFKRVDFIKIDVEGMEIDVLIGATRTITKCAPILYIEHDIVGVKEIKLALPEYVFMEPMGQHNLLCIHSEDPVLKTIRG